MCWQFTQARVPSSCLWRLFRQPELKPCYISAFWFIILANTLVKGFKFLTAVHPVCGHTSSFYDQPRLPFLPTGCCSPRQLEVTGRSCPSNKPIALGHPSAFQPMWAGLAQACYLHHALRCDWRQSWCPQPGWLLQGGKEKGGPKVCCSMSTASCLSVAAQGGVPGLVSWPLFKHFSRVWACTGEGRV